MKLIESDEINILQSVDDNKGTISVTSALVLQFADDRDAIASLIARQHVRQTPSFEKEKSPTASKFLDMLGSAVNSAVDSKVGVTGVGQTLSEGGSEVIRSTYSEAQEKAADEASINWMLEAGYNPYGAVRAQKKLLVLSEAGKTSAMNQHQPTSADRVAYLEALVDDNAKSKELSGEGKRPLWARIQDSNIVPAVAASTETTTASVHRGPEGTAASADSSSDEPIDGFSLSRYAAIKNDIAFMGESPALAKHNLTQDAFSRLDQQWATRMAQDKSLNLSKRYANQYLEASQGDFADWGKDVAQVRQTGRLQLGTDPTAVDDWLVLQKMQKELASGGPEAATAFAKAVKEKGLSLYDFHIIHSWWTQRSKDQAAKGDNSLLQRML